MKIVKNTKIMMNLMNAKKEIKRNKTVDLNVEPSY